MDLPTDQEILDLTILEGMANGKDGGTEWLAPSWFREFFTSIGGSDDDASEWLARAAKEGWVRDNGLLTARRTLTPDGLAVVEEARNRRTNRALRWRTLRSRLLVFVDANVRSTSELSAAASTFLAKARYSWFYGGRFNGNELTDAINELEQLELIRVARAGDGTTLGITPKGRDCVIHHDADIDAYLAAQRQPGAAQSIVQSPSAETRSKIPAWIRGSWGVLVGAATILAAIAGVGVWAGWNPFADPDPLTATDVRSVAVVGGLGGELLDPYHVTSSRPGECSVSSIVIPEDPNAYRCSFGNKLADPCFAMKQGSAAACIVGPWDHSVLEVLLKRRVSYDSSAVISPSEQRPWAPEVQDPHDPGILWRCLPETGATVPHAGHQPTYWCRSDNSEGGGSVLDDVRIKPGQLAEVLFDSSEQPGDIETAEVATAWR
jgi:hypothetical protein